MHCWVGTWSSPWLNAIWVWRVLSLKISLDLLIILMETMTIMNVNMRSPDTPRRGRSFSIIWSSYRRDTSVGAEVLSCFDSFMERTWLNFTFFSTPFPWLGRPWRTDTLMVYTVFCRTAGKLKVGTEDRRVLLIPSPVSSSSASYSTCSS